MKLRHLRAPALLIVFMLLGAALPVAARHTSTTSSTRKIMVDSRDGATREELTRSGARLLVDYGAFSLWSVPGAAGLNLLGQPGAAAPDDIDTIALRGGRVVDTRAGDTAALADSRRPLTSGARLWMVQFVGPVKDAWLEELRSLGLEIVQYMPNNAYVVWGDAAGLDRLAALAATSPVVQWSGAYRPEYRLEPSLQRAAVERAGAELLDVTVQLYKTAGVERSLGGLRALGGRVYREPSQILNLVNISLQLPAGQLPSLAGWADVYNIEPYHAPTQLDERQSQIMAGNLVTAGGKVGPSGPGYLAWLQSHGFPTTPSSYPLVDVIDDGLDQGNAEQVLHPDFHEFGQAGNPDRVVAIADCTIDPSGNAVGGHGNINAGILAAYNDRSGSPHVDSNGYRLGLGISPYSRLAATKIFRNAGFFDISQCGGNDRGVVAASYAKGAQITSNSWGTDVRGAYDSAAQTYDVLTRDASQATAGNQEMLHIFAAGNDGAGSQTVGSPGTAKNVLTVGATEGVRGNGIPDGCGLSAADNADDIAGFSSRGPSSDGRIKPDIVAPGTHIQGPASQDSGFTGASVCGGVQSPYYPSNQTLYTWSSGTSHSTPAVAGAAALLYVYYGRVLAPGRTPSPAMLKALLLNTPRYLTGADANDTLPSPHQGWGGANMGMLFDDTPRVLADQGRLLQASGDVYTLLGQVEALDKPFRVSLAWTDARGNTTGSAYVNDLDLEVTVDGQVYRGNVFDRAGSTTGGAFDGRNNVENVFLPPGTSGDFTVRVIARNVAGDGVPGNGDPTDQDFALVIANATADPQGLLEGRVVDAGGAPLANTQIQVQAGAETAARLTTGADGRYGPVDLPPGSYDITASAYGYVAQTSAGVSLAAGEVLAQNFSLAVAPRVAVSGVVRDGSGHGWPLYARIEISAAGQTSTTFTNPASGQYRVELVANELHTFAVNAVSPGYSNATRAFTPTSTGVEDFALNVDAQACIAPGYQVEEPDCIATPGGLLIGSVLDANTGAPVVGATVSHADGAAVSFGTPGDQATSDGLYILFSPPGAHAVTASAPGAPYGSDTRTVNVTANTVVTEDFHLPAGRLVANPARLDVRIGPGGTTRRNLVIDNIGGLGAAFGLQEVNFAPGGSGGGIPWLSSSAANGTVAVGGSQTLTLTFDAAALNRGTYTGELRVGNDTPYLLVIPVTLTVGEVETIYLPMVRR